jgi:TetR/AcrR family transcriptional regulator of autoinduction and epiphytic fitness
MAATMREPGKTDEHFDGRRERGRQTHLGVLDALIDLYREGDLHPTAKAVADRAGVALRTVYYHFSDVEELRLDAFELVLDRSLDTLGPIEVGLPAGERCLVVAQRVRRFHEATTPVRRALELGDTAWLRASQVLGRARALRRSFIERAFADALAADAWGDTGSRRVFLDALDVTTSFQHWDHLRSVVGRGAPASERVVAWSLSRLVAGSGRVRDRAGVWSAAGATERAGDGAARDRAPAGQRGRGGRRPSSARR